MKVQDLRAGGDAQKRYFVIHRPVEPPPSGWRTLFVLPGGAGNADFQPFITRIAKKALPEGYLVVQLVAPVWSPAQAENLVWPTDQMRLPEVKFTTSELFLKVRAEVAKAHQVDPRYSFTLTWSSSGMNGYGLSLLPKSGVTGTFVAMSVFHPRQLPPLAAAKGHPWFLSHSPQDFIPIAQPEAARTALQRAGAIGMEAGSASENGGFSQLDPSSHSLPAPDCRKRKFATLAPAMCDRFVQKCREVRTGQKATVLMRGPGASIRCRMRKRSSADRPETRAATTGSRRGCGAGAGARRVTHRFTLLTPTGS